MRHRPADLAPVGSTDDWHAYHRIRRQVLWDARGRAGYDEAHPDDRRPGHHPFLLKLGGLAIGTVRLDDIGGGAAAVRLVAVAPDRQRQGYGRAMLMLVEAEAARRGLTILTVNAARYAVGFYVALGWSPGSWADPGDISSDVESDPMIKHLGRGP